MKTIKKTISIIFVAVIMALCAIIPSYALGGQTRYSVLVLDVSGSMSGERIEQVKTASKLFVEQVLGSKKGDKNYIAVVSFDSSSRVVCDFSDDESLLDDSIDKLRASGSTNLAAGINDAYDLLKVKDPTAIKNIFIFCDGYPNVGSPDGETAALNAVMNIPNGYNIYSLYFSGGYVDERAKTLMEQIGVTDHWVIDDPEKIKVVFADEWSKEAAEQEVNKIILRVACPVDVSVELNGVVLDKNNPQTLFGTLEFEGPEDDQTKIVTLRYNDSYVIKIVGTGTGTMDYSVAYYCNDEELYNLTYPTIDITPQTIVNGKVNFEDKEIKLELDKDGDGVIDSLVSPGGKTPGGLFKRFAAFIKKIFVEFWEHIVRLANINIDFLERR